MTFRDRAALVPALLCLFAANSSAQTPAAAPPAVPADVSPLYVVTYVEAKPTARDEAAALLKSYREASRSSSGNLRSVVVRSVVLFRDDRAVPDVPGPASSDAGCLRGPACQLGDRLRRRGLPWPH